LEDCRNVRVAERLQLTSKIGQVGYRIHGFAAMCLSSVRLEQPARVGVPDLW